MRTLVAYLTVLVAAAVPWLEVLLVVPVGILAGLSPTAVVVVAAVGNVASLVPVVLGGDRLRAWWRARRRARMAAANEADGSPGTEAGGSPGGGPPAASGRSARAQRVLDRYGLPGVALLGPLLTGIHVAALAALAAGAPKRPTLLWSTAGVVVWSAVTGVATVLGIDALVDPDALPDLGL